MSARKSRSRRNGHRGGKKGCFFWGCTSVFALFCAVITLAGLGLYVLISRRAADFPAFTATDAQYQSVQARVQQFTDALDAHQAASPLVLTSEDLNTLLLFDPRLSTLKNKIHVAIEGDRFTGFVSFPVGEYEELRRWLPQGSYLNGKASFVFTMHEGLPAAHISSLELKGIAAPEIVLNRLREENLLKPLLRDKTTQSWAESLQAIRVKNGAIILYARGETGSARLVESTDEGAPGR